MITEDLIIAIRELSHEDLAAVLAAVASRLAEPRPAPEPPLHGAQDDTSLTIEEAAALLRRSTKFYIAIARGCRSSRKLARVRTCARKAPYSAGVTANMTEGVCRLEVATEKAHSIQDEKALLRSQISTDVPPPSK